MEDLSVDAEVGRLMTERLASGQPLALVCHGPAALLTSAGTDGTSPFAGYRLTSLTNAEERQNGLADNAKWLLEDRLVELGVEYRAGEPWAPHVEADRNLYTGQNPASAVPLAQEVLNALRAAESDSPNIALVRRMYDSKGDPAVTREIMAPDIVWDVTPGFPLGGVYNGYDSMANDFFGSLLDRFDSFYAQGEQFYADDDNHVFVLGHYHATTKNGTSTTARFIHLWTIRDGKLAHMQQAADSLLVERALN
jgi:ketosteroid isomerase-like protein